MPVDQTQARKKPITKAVGELAPMGLAKTEQQDKMEQTFLDSLYLIVASSSWQRSGRPYA